MKKYLLMAILLAFIPAARAQDNKIIYPVRTFGPSPGSAWMVFGNITPVEKNNVLASAHIEQGRVEFRRDRVDIELYAAAGLNLDSKGYVWNNNYSLQSGVKLNKALSHGVVSFGTAYAYENRYKAGQTASGPIGYVEDWFGWHPAEYETSRFPGSTWAVFGNIAPIEHNNRIGMGHIQQGFVAKRNDGWAFVPFIEETFSTDSKRFDWNNFSRTGAGMKMVGAPGVEFGASYIEERRFQSGLKAGGFAVFLKLWKGWDLRRGYGSY